MAKRIVLDENVLKKRYRLRRTGKQWLSWETTIPREVLEREARKRGIPMDEIDRRFEVEWSFDNFDGLHMVLVEVPRRTTAEEKNDAGR